MPVTVRHQMLVEGRFNYSAHHARQRLVDYLMHVYSRIVKFWRCRHLPGVRSCCIGLLDMLLL